MAGTLEHRTRVSIIGLTDVQKKNEPFGNGNVSRRNARTDDLVRKGGRTDCIRLNGPLVFLTEGLRPRDIT